MNKCSLVFVLAPDVIELLVHAEVELHLHEQAQHCSTAIACCTVACIHRQLHLFNSTLLQILPPKNDSEHDRQMHRRQLQETSSALPSEAMPFFGTPASPAAAGQQSSLVRASHVRTRDTLRGHALPFMSDSSLKLKVSKTVGKAHVPWVAASAAAHAASMATTSQSTFHGVENQRGGRLPEPSHSHSGSQLNGMVASSNRAFRPPGK